jgi:hypothetical protein
LSKNIPNIPPAWKLSPFSQSWFGKISASNLELRLAPVKLLPQILVGVTGLEPVTLRLSSACSNQLSYTPYWNFKFQI